MGKRTITELQMLIKKLQAERRAHVDAIAEIDETFGELGISAETKKGARRARRKRKAPAKRRKRGRFKVSGSSLILAYVKKAGKKGVTSGQIDRYWKSVGRRGAAYNGLGRLVQAKKIKRQKVKGQRGSVYAAA